MPEKTTEEKRKDLLAAMDAGATEIRTRDKRVVFDKGLMDDSLSRLTDSMVKQGKIKRTRRVQIIGSKGL